MNRKRVVRSKLDRYVNRLRPPRLRDWVSARCDDCGHRRRFTESWHTYGNRDGKVWHGPCIAYRQWRTHAEERLVVLDLVCDVWAVTQQDVESVVGLRTADDANGSVERNRAWRVMHALGQHRAAASSSAGGER